MKEVLEVIIKNLVNNKDAVEIKEVENEKYIQIVKRHNELLKECNEKDYIKYVYS